MEEYVKIDTARIAKQKGFDLRMFEYYIDNIPSTIINGAKENHNRKWGGSVGLEYTSRPTQSVLQRWLRNKNIVVIPIPKLQYPDNVITNEYNVLIYKDGKECESFDGTYDGYENSLEEGLKFGLNLI